MGRKCKGKSRRQKQHLWTQFSHQSNLQAFRDDSKFEVYNEEQRKHVQHIKELKEDILSRTVLVGSVLPLGVERNRIELKRFMESRYGPVQKLDIGKRKGRFPSGRVTFNYKHDAERIFQGTTLAEARKKKLQEKVLCPSVGYKGLISVRPSYEYKGMTHDDLNTKTFIQINTRKLSLGHWFPQGADSSVGLLSLEEISATASTWVEEKQTEVDAILSIDMEKALIELDVTDGVKGDMTLGSRTVLSFRFKDLAHPLELCRHRRSFSRNESLYFAFGLSHPPRLTSVIELLDQEHRIRLTDIGFSTSGASSRLGSCLGYRLEVSSVEVDRLINARAFEKVKKMGLFQCEEDSNLLQQAKLLSVEKVSDRQRCRFDTNILSIPNHRLGLQLRSVVDNQSCSWFDMLIDQTMLNDSLQGQDIFDLAKGGDYYLVERVLTTMRNQHGKTRHPAKLFRALYEAGKDEDEMPRQIPDYCCSLPRLLLSPLRVSVSGFEVEMSNRIVRRFIEDVGFSNEAFVRLSVGDESGDKLFSDDLSKFVETKIKSLVLNGIVLGKKKYIFLAYSSSQLKEQSMWMVCPEKGWSVPRMRRSMGDFTMCKTAAKTAARMGQCFSTTIDTTYGAEDGGLFNLTRRAFGFDQASNVVDSKKLHVKVNLHDITSTDVSTGRLMEHSDGVGLIRHDVLKELLKQVPFGPKYKKDISAIQIRYGGAKGVLVAWDFKKLVDHRINGYDVCLRPSMIKFNAPYDSLEVVNLAKAIPYFLNRAVILLGSFKGIPDRRFLDLQSNHLSNLNRMLSDAKFAASFLPSLSGPDNGLVGTLRDMIYAGIEPSMDPFLYSCLHSIRSHHLMNLRKKARIFVEKGVVLIGGIDETGLLREGCIYLRVPRTDSSNQDGDGYTVIEGPVMVTKHPVMHPGKSDCDMRMLTAVDVPELRDKKNVVLFSRHGDRPEADKMSGSDLDGDQFAITWDRRLFLGSTSAPMDYTPPQKPSETNSITDDMLLSHFINHARNDNLGRIATLWLDHASIKKSAACAACLQLAKLASIAVDFPKTGIPAVIPKDVLLKRTTPRAHWREHPFSPSFRCKSTVGQLYDRVIDEMKSENNAPRLQCTAMAGRFRDNNWQVLYMGDPRRILDSKISIYNPILSRRLGWKGDDLDMILLDYAEYQQYLYESQLLELMNQFKIKCEGEVASGCILKYHKLHKRRRHDISEEVRRQFRHIRKTFRSEFLTAVYHLVKNNTAFFDGDADDEVEDDVAEEELDWIEDAATSSPMSSSGEATICKVKLFAFKLAAAYYMTTYSPDLHIKGSKTVLYSFPWVVAADVIACGVSEGS